MNAAMSGVDDGELVRRALRGDQSAVGEIYDRYADSIYSLCRSRLRNDADAADATQETFLRAAMRLSQLREPNKLRSWLYAIARNQIITTGRTSARMSGDIDMDLIAAPDAEPEIDLLRVEAANQLWAAAEGLSERDKDVLELHLRHGLVGQDLADSLGVSEPHANVLLSRMRDRVATSLGSLMVAREGRENCHDLGLLLATWDGRFTLDIRSKVTRHVRACDTCEQTQTRVLASGISFGILPIIPAPSGLRIDTLAKMSDALGISTAASAPTDVGIGSLQFADPIPYLRPQFNDPDGWEWLPSGFPGALSTTTSRSVVVLSAAALFILLVVLGGITAAVFNDDSGIETAAAVQVAGAVETTPPSIGAAGEASDSGTPRVPGAASMETSSSTVDETSTTQIVSIDPASTQAVAPGSEPSTSTETEAPSTTANQTTAAPTIAPTVTSTTSTSTSTTSSTSSSTSSSSTTSTLPPPSQPPVFVRAAARPALVQVDRGRCKGDTVDVIVQVTDPDGEIESVVVEWFSGVGRTRQVKLAPVVGAAVGTYLGTIGTWVEEGSQTSTIRAWDNDGDSASTSVTVTVTGCPAG